jgi:hypothetical protein
MYTGLKAVVCITILLATMKSQCDVICETGYEAGNRHSFLLFWLDYEKSPLKTNLLGARDEFFLALRSRGNNNQIGAFFIEDGQGSSKQKMEPKVLSGMETNSVNGCAEFPFRALDDSFEKFRVFDTVNSCNGGSGILVGHHEDQSKLQNVGNCYSVSQTFRSKNQLELLHKALQEHVPWDCALPAVQISSYVKRVTQPSILDLPLINSFNYDCGSFRQLSGAQVKECGRFLGKFNYLTIYRNPKDPPLTIKDFTSPRNSQTPAGNDAPASANR